MRLVVPDQKYKLQEPIDMSSIVSTNQPKIVVIGGGGGSYTLLKALKEYTKDLTALVSMADDGGSTGILRNELNVLPAGDVRQCLVALSDLEDVRDIFNYRFGEGKLAGHSLGNLFLAAAEKQAGNFAEAIELAGKLLQIKGRVLPITLTNCRLTMETAAETVLGEDTIRDLPIPLTGQSKLYLTPKATAYGDALQAIHDADLVVIAPGNLYGSILPALIVDGIAEAIQTTNAKVIYVANLLNLHHKTLGPHDYAKEIERFIGDGAIDYVLYNIDELTPQMLKESALETEFPVVINPEQFKQATYRAIGGKFLSHQEQTRNPNDKMTHRSLIRHDAHEVAKVLLDIYSGA